MVFGVVDGSAETRPLRSAFGPVTRVMATHLAMWRKYQISPPHLMIPILLAATQETAYSANLPSSRKARRERRHQEYIKNTEPEANSFLAPLQLTAMSPPRCYGREELPCTAF